MKWWRSLQRIIPILTILIGIHGNHANPGTTIGFIPPRKTGKLSQYVNSNWNKKSGNKTPGVSPLQQPNLPLNNLKSPSTMLTPPQRRKLIKTAALQRNIIKDMARRWPNQVVPYNIKPGFTLQEIEKIKGTLDLIMAKSCIKFVPTTTDPQALQFIKGYPRTCFSYVGTLNKWGLANTIILHSDCLGKQVMHEIFHVLGFEHETARADRDQYVKINFENIQPKFADQYKNFDANTMQHIGEYDTESIMHYDSRAFALNPSLPAITTINGDLIGLNTIATEKDWKKLNTLYECTNYPQYTT